MLSFKHLLNFSQVTKTDLEQIFQLASQFQQQPRKQISTAHGKILATLFFEPSTRTRLSFESAILRLGGGNISLESGQSSSVQKGETLYDTAKVVENYADIVVFATQKKVQQMNLHVVLACL